jgi:NADH-quinone oxidoreductase subunit K
MTGDPNIFLVTSIGLFILGVFGVLIRRNALLVLMSIELMLNAVNMAFITFARGFGSSAGTFEEGSLGLVQAAQGHVFALMVMAVAAAEAAIGIAIFVSIYRSKGRVLVDEARELRG